MEEKVKISILLSLYGNLLTETQKRYMHLYYNEDFSLSEIGDNENITRQAVRTILVKSKAKLQEYETKLKCMEKERVIKKAIQNLEKTELNQKQRELVTNIDKELSF